MNLNKKKCPRCQTWLGRPAFNKCASRADGLQGHCRTCHRLAIDAWRARNKVREAAVHAAWYLKNKEKVNRKSAEWYAANRDSHNERVITRRRENPVPNRQVQADRRAAKKTGLFEAIDLEVVWIRDLGVCRLCGELADVSNWHLEHLVPLSRGGDHTYVNVAVSHPDCNWKKHTKTLTEYYTSKYLKNTVTS